MSAKMFVPLATLVLIGVGCAPVDRSAPQKTSEKPPVEQSKVPVQVSEPRLLAPATIDDTWKTYTSKSLGFSFDWPTRGRYAPTWEVLFFKDTDAEVADCYALPGAVAGEAEKARLGDREFCVVHAKDVTGASTVYRDAYRTAVGKTIVVIVFEKKPVSAEFSETEHAAFLDSIVGTFRLQK